MKFATLEGKRVAVWGFGREGRAALAALRRRLPEQSLTLYCNAAEAADLSLGDGVEVCATPPDAGALASFDYVIKSPGISVYQPEIVAAQARGTVFTSGTALWFGENPDARVVAVTGTKGKSTTSALIAHLARALGVRTALAGNIGLPLLELDGQHADLWVIELSSFQTSEAGPLELGVIVSLAEEHLDWHGSRERYVADKLKLAAVARSLLVDAATPLLVERTASHPHRIFFDVTAGWHAAAASRSSFPRRREPIFEDADKREHQDVGLMPDGRAEPFLCNGEQPVVALANLPLHGLHNAHNACAALAAIELLGFDASTAAPSLRDFTPLPHRLTSLGQHDHIEWIDDSIATTPDAAAAALESLAGRALTLILGGHDRGLDWDDFARTLAARPPLAVLTQGAAGPRIARALRAAGVACILEEAVTLAAAVTRARALTPANGVVLLSPGAPSFDQFRDYAQRGRRFAELAGFDAAAIGAIPGLGIA